MKIVSEFNYRNAKEIIQKTNPELFEEIQDILNKELNQLNLKLPDGKMQRDTSRQIQEFFVQKSWKKEVQCRAIPEMKYDLVKDENFPIEIEVGHMRLVYADFFEYLADYSKEFIKAGIMIVCADPLKFGHKWQNSIKSTKIKLKRLKNLF